MAAARPERPPGARIESLRPGSRWVVAIPREWERRLYFLAMLALVAWYLLDRAL